jgi:hypothetical protein
MIEGNPLNEVRGVLRAFQEGYTRRDAAAVDAFMDLFVPDDDLEVIGTGGVRPGVDEWYLGRAGARELVASDWEGWGDLALDVDGAHIHALGDVAWLAASATVTMSFSAEESYRGYLERIKTVVEETDWPPQEKLLYLLRGGSNTLYELNRGERFVWPLRFTAVLVRREGQWRFHQMEFSFPTAYYPDVREFPTWVVTPT